MGASRAADKAFLASATPEEIKAAIAEVVQRFCDKQENQAQCEKYEDTVISNMEVAITSATAQEVQVEVGLPNAAIPSDAVSGMNPLICLTALWRTLTPPAP